MREDSPPLKLHYPLIDIPWRRNGPRDFKWRIRVVAVDDLSKSVQGHARSSGFCLSLRALRLCEKLSYLLAYQNLSQARKARKEEKSSPANSELETLVHRRRCFSFRIEERRLHYARAHAMAH